MKIPSRKFWRLVRSILFDPVIWFAAVATIDGWAHNHSRPSPECLCLPDGVIQFAAGDGSIQAVDGAHLLVQEPFLQS